MRYVFVAALFVAFGFWSSSANATVDVSIDLTHQRMNVTSSSGNHSWPISTARAGYVTPRGVFRPQAVYRMTYSRIYGNSPMPHAIFFNGGYAIHGTYATGALGSPASHGCVRLAPGNAAALYDMVKAEGARITIEGTPPASRLAKSTRGKDTKLARAGRSHGTKYAAHGKRGHGTRYAQSSHGTSHAAVGEAQPQSQPAPQDMLGLFGGGF